jgi:hypothetical protein
MERAQAGAGRRAAAMHETGADVTRRRPAAGAARQNASRPAHAGGGHEGVTRQDHHTAPACRGCLMTDPPPDQTCYQGQDHYIGPPAGCPGCGRLAAACARRPCSARRGAGRGRGSRRGAARPAGPR